MENSVNYEAFRNKRINQCKEDGLYNILPLVERFNKNPKQLKEMFGESLWKSICKQNKKTIQIINDCFRPECYVPDYWFEGLSAKPKAIEFTLENTLYESLVEEVRRPSITSLKLQLSDIVNMYYRFNKDKDEKHIYISYLLDVIDFAYLTNNKFNKNWSRRRLIEEHDKLSRLAMLREIGVDLDFHFPVAKKLEDMFLKGIYRLRRNENPLINRMEVSKLDNGNYLFCQLDDYVNVCYSTPDYSNVSGFKESWVLRSDPVLRPFVSYAFEVKLLRTPQDLIDESSHMNHCIGNYVKSFLNANYMAFRVICHPLTNLGHRKKLYLDSKNITGREATVGISASIEEAVTASFNQDYNLFYIDQISSYRNNIPSKDICVFVNDFLTEYFFRNIGKMKYKTF